ncbi:MAG: response regulator, partial [Pseudomonadota bacterium]
RFLLAALVLLVAMPLSIVINRFVPQQRLVWLEPLCELLFVVTFVHFVPQWWVAALCVGLVVALAPSVSLHPKSFAIYTGLAAVLLLGMAVAAVTHDVPGWHILLLVVTLIYPSVLYYAHWQVRYITGLRDRSQRLESVTDMAGKVAHDFNNVLMGISGHAELAQQGLSSEHPVYRSLDEVIEGTERASLLCGQLLSFAGRSVADARRLDLATELRTIVELLRPVVPSGVTIDVQIPPFEFPIRADRGQLQQVLTSVIVNAGEAVVDDARPVTVDVTRRRSANQPGFCVTVADHGRGVNEHALAGAFDPFSSTKERSQGLASDSVSHIMREQGGSIDIATDAAAGTRVNLWWPEVPVEVSAMELRDTSDTSTSGTTPATLLVVDDEPRVLAATSRLLERAGYRVLTARDADSAERVFKQQRSIDAVVLDLKLPDRDGWDCLDQLRRQDPTIPVVVCSGYDPQPDSTRRTMPAVGYLQKPFRIAELERVLATLSAVHEPAT